jgi:hypothetical protein
MSLRAVEHTNVRSLYSKIEYETTNPEHRVLGKDAVTCHHF